MKKLLLLFTILYTFITVGQDQSLTHVAVSDQAYYEIYTDDDALIVFVITAKDNELMSNAVRIKSFAHFKRTYQPSKIEKARSLDDNWTMDKKEAITSSSNFIFRVDFSPEETIDFRYLKEIEEEPYPFWCAPAEPVVFFEREVANSKVVFVVNKDKLGVIWRHHSKGLFAYSAALFE